MNIWEKSLLLILLRRHLETERTVDWQTLHKRDRSWALAQPEQSAWRLLRGWLQQWGRLPLSGTRLFVYGTGVAACMLGFLLMAGLVAFLPLQRINLLWFMLIALFLPVAWWLLALFFNAAQVPLPLRTLYEHRLPQGSFPDALRPLLKQTVIALGQQLSLLFSVGMVIAFLLYLLMTDLAFGWSSTLDLGSDLIHRITETLAWPWRTLWPAAVPSLELIEQTHYFRAAPLVTESPALFGLWWRFLLMCLLVYVLLPRLFTTTLARIRLHRMQGRVCRHDALISGLQQRLTTELVDQEAERVEQRETADSAIAIEPMANRYTQIVCWGIWPDEVVGPLRERLVGGDAEICWIDIASPLATEAALTTLARLPDQPLLLLCKGWEPPTGALADLCGSLAAARTRLFLWPVPLEGMDVARQHNLIRSWRPFMRQISDRFHLISATLEAGVVRG